MSLNGCVKWFNSKKGYGFITVITPDSEHVGKDIFAHYTHVTVKDNSYKRLFPGEYVAFNLGKNDDRDVCTDITGVYGGRLLADHEEYRFKYFPKNTVKEEVPSTAQGTLDVEGDEDQDPEQ